MQLSFGMNIERIATGPMTKKRARIQNIGSWIIGRNGKALQVLSVKLAGEKGKGVQESYICSRMDLMHEPD